MSPRVLIAGHEVPGYSGTTAAYQLFQMMRASGLDVHHLNIIDEGDDAFFRYAFGESFGNPKSLPNVHNCILTEPIDDPHPPLNDLLRRLSADLSIAVGHLAALMMKRSAPEKKVILLTHGCRQMLRAIELGQVPDFIAQERIIASQSETPFQLERRETEAVEICDFIIPHSDSTELLYRHFYPAHCGKISSEVVWFGEWTYEEALEYASFKKPFDERDIDLLFIAGAWNRPEKNYALVERIASKLPDLNVHVVGEYEKAANLATHHGLVVAREDLFSLMGRAKTVACPSLFDAAPGILFEASALGCNLVASRNCGNWKLCNEALLVNAPGAEEFVNRIRLSVTRKYQDNIDYFLGKKSFATLLETVSVLCAPH